MTHRFKIRIVPQLHVLSSSFKPALFSAMRAAMKHERTDKPCEIQLTLVTDNMIYRLNRVHRNIHKVTDVLSFPLTEQRPGKSIRASAADVNPDTGRVCLGDIIISLPQAFRQSREYGHTIERELKFLTVHSVLHLLGYDHELEDDRKLMRKREKAIMERLDK